MMTGGVCRCLVLLAALFLFPQARADDPSNDAAAVEKGLKEAARRIEPSLALVLVSRSEAYQKLFHEAAPATPGQLGGFEPARATARLPAKPGPEIAGLEKALAEQSPGADAATIRAELVRALKKRYDLADPDYVPTTYGGGVVVGRDGLVLTYFHVVRDATKLYVRLPGLKGGCYADIWAADPRSDLAVLRILDRSLLPLTPVTRGDGGVVEQGQLVLAVALPFAGRGQIAPSVSKGIISAFRHRTPTRPIVTDWEENDQDLFRYGNLIQTDARTHSGLSGGALVDLKGRLVGLTTALGGTLGADFGGALAVPLDQNKWRIVDVLERGEEVEHGFLGILFNNRFGVRGDGPVMVNMVVGNSPAWRAKLQGRDVILAVDGQPVRTTDEARLAIGSLLAGAEVRLKVRSWDGDERTVTTVLTKAYQLTHGIAAHPRPFAHGLRVDYTSVLVQRGWIASQIPSGVVVREVEPGSAAAKAGLTDARITSVNGKEVNTPAEFYKAVREAERAGGSLQLTVAGRRGTSDDQTVTLP